MYWELKINDKAVIREYDEIQKVNEYVDRTGASKNWKITDKDYNELKKYTFNIDSLTSGIPFPGCYMISYHDSNKKLCTRRFSDDYIKIIRINE